MGGGRRPKSITDVVLEIPRPKHKNGSQLSSIGTEGNGEGSDVSLNRCKTFYLHKTKTAIAKLKIGTVVFGEVNGRSIEVKSQELGPLGVVPPGTAALMIQEGRDVHWTGEVMEVDKDRLSVKIRLCPT